MKTKNFLLAAVLLISGLLSVNGVFAETPVSESKLNDNVTLNIVLKPIQAITVNPDSKNVEIVYEYITDYANGVTTGAIKDHLTVYSTGGFTVSVKSETDNFINLNNPTKTIPAGDVKITAEGSVGKFSDVTLAASEGSGSNIISSTKGGRKLNYDVTYNNTTDLVDRYIDKYIAADGEESVYTATVTYTIAAQ